MTASIRVAVIMAGGTGERYWPLSRRDRPKQLLRLNRPDMTLLDESVARVRGPVEPERIFVATARDLVEPIRRATPNLPPENILGEPCKRNTAGALVYAAGCLLARWPDRPVSMAVLTADHRIEPVEAFARTLNAAFDAAERDGVLTTIGIVPDRPETGYGYIEVAADAEVEADVSRVARFCEKPDRDTAARYLATGRFLWNSGMYVWRVDRFLEELDRFAPAHAAAARAIAEALAAGDSERADAAFAELPDLSIEYAMIEKAAQDGRVTTTRAAFAWDDVGAWDALDRSWPTDEHGNVLAGDPIVIEAHNNIVYNEPGAERMAVAAVGVEGLVVVVAEDAVLVVPKDRVQDVKRVVAELKRRGARQR